MSLKIKKLSKKEMKKYKKDRKDNFNFYHYAYFSMSEYGLSLFIEELKRQHYHFNIYETKGGGDSSWFKIHITKGKRHNFKEEKFKRLTLWDYHEIKMFSISWIDNADSDNLFKCLENLNMEMIYAGESGGWDATPYYLVGNVEIDKEFERSYELYQNESAYHTLKSLSEKDKFYEKKIKLQEIEKYLKELEMSDEEIHFYIVKPNEYLFGKTVIEILLLNQEDGLINMLKAKLGYPDAKPF